MEALLKTTLIAHRAAGTHWIEVGSGDAPGVDTSTTQTFTLSVNAVNDQPSFSAVDPAVVNEDAGALLVDVDHARAPEIPRLLVNAGPGLFALEPLSFDLEKAFVEVMSLAGTAPAAGSAS